MEYRLIESNKYVLGMITLAHADLVLHSTFTNMEPSHLSPYPQMTTCYGFKDCDIPIIKYKTTWEHNNRKATEKTEYFLCIPNNAED